MSLSATSGHKAKISQNRRWNKCLSPYPSAVSCLYCEHDQVHQILHRFTTFLDDRVDE